MNVAERKERSLVYISDHHKEPCDKCADDASKYNHCAYCGADCNSQSELLAHFDNCDDLLKVLASM